jgi:DNA-binding Xre family transcriptional regulator
VTCAKSLECTHRSFTYYRAYYLSVVGRTILIVKIDGESKRKLKKIGLRIRSARQRRGWTLEETEEHGWPAWRHLQKIEAGKNVTVVTLFKVCRLLKIAPSDLLRDL